MKSVKKTVAMVIAIVVALLTYLAQEPSSSTQPTPEKSPSQPAEVQSIPSAPSSTPTTSQASTSTALVRSSEDSKVAHAFENHLSDIQVFVTGTIIKSLPDDNIGSRHQKFIMRLASGRTLLVSHNIDLAPRIPGSLEGRPVSVMGEYEWNENGGVIHWTHHDPAQRHPDGYIFFNGATFQ
ncbi:MAG: DUF3465 domain-containing protein [Verrucomicrobia bacterium]|nr:DUF3465 domain-containing protein [Verrucomicrobiota bacterium]